MTSAINTWNKLDHGLTIRAARRPTMIALFAATLAFTSSARTDEAPLPAIPVPQPSCADSGPALDGCRDAQVMVRFASSATEHRIQSARARRDAGVVKQHYDYSCGSASLATLLNYGLNDPADENELLRALLEQIPAERLATLQKDGLSLYDLQQLAQQRGHKAQGFRLHQSQLAALTRPVMVFIKPRGYEHFAVLKGIRGDRVHLADPSLGNVRMPLYRFLDMWSDDSGRGIIFAVEKASGDWPDRYALQLASSTGVPLEALSAEHLMQIGKPFLSTLPNR